jgi:hypothetical protein
MKTRFASVLTIFFVHFLFPTAVFPAVYYPENEAGTPVCLFESGTDEIKRAVAVNDTMIVYRTTTKGTLQKVGKIRVVSIAGNYFIHGVIVSGVLSENDIAIKGSIACIIISFEGLCPQ